MPRRFAPRNDMDEAAVRLQPYPFHCVGAGFPRPQRLPLWGSWHGEAVTERAVRFRPSPSPAGKAMDAAVNPHRADTQVGPYPVE